MPRPIIERLVMDLTLARADAIRHPSIKKYAPVIFNVKYARRSRIYFKQKRVAEAWSRRLLEKHKILYDCQQRLVREEAELPSLKRFYRRARKRVSEFIFRVQMRLADKKRLRGAR